ncbi:MAG: L,D-transpeptidase [Myxococcota bacterium]
MVRLSASGLALWGLVVGAPACDGDAHAESAPTPPPAADLETEPRAPSPATAAAPSADAQRRAPEAPDDPPLLHLEPPPMRAPVVVDPYRITPSAPSPRIAQAYQFDAPVYRRPSAKRSIVGLVRRNTRLAVTGWTPGEGCARSWYALTGGGFVCSSDGYNVSADPAPLRETLQVGAPAMDQALPYRYAKLKTPAPLYFRPPTEAELASGSSAPIRELAQGAHFVAMDRTLPVGEQTLHRTVRGFYVREEDLEAKPMPTMHGELLAGADALPLAFVHVDEAALVDPHSGAARGTAAKFARFTIDRIGEHEGQRQVIATEGFAVAAESVRVVRPHPRPPEIGADARWIHVNLDQQTLVAYEGDRPVLATLVSSGKAGFEPPLGVFRVHKKYTTVTMSGPDPDAGTYAVEQVPWTMYYWGSYALHGAYWHDIFGNVRSHGCTNIPPVDARWLFHWAEPSLLPGWHAQVGLKGPWVYFTRTPTASPTPEPSARSAAP